MELSRKRFDHFKPGRSKRPGYVYIVEAVGTEAIKVGFTSLDPEKRLRDLQTGSHHELKFIALFSVSKDYERVIHDVLKKHHIRGEWYNREGLDLRAIVDAAIKFYGGRDV